MKKSFGTLLLVGLALRVYGLQPTQPTILIDNANNSGVYGGYGGLPFNGSSGDPTYSSGVTSNGLIFTLDPSGQAGKLGYSSLDSKMLGVDVSFELYGVPTPAQATNPIVGLTGAGIYQDNYNWGQLIPGNPVGGTAYNVPGTTAPPTGTMVLVYLDLQLWEGGTYADFATAKAAGDYVADSGVFANPSGGGTPLPAPPKDLTGLPDMLLTQIPEPSTFTLSLLAASAFVLRCRRPRIGW